MFLGNAVRVVRKGNPAGAFSSSVALVAALVILVVASCAPDDPENDVAAPDESEDVTVEGPEYVWEFAAYIGPDAPQMQAAQWLGEELNSRSGGRIQVEYFWAESLVSGSDMLSGVAEGRATIGHLGTIFTESELPLSQVTTLPFVTQNVAAVGRTLQDMRRDTPAFYEEYRSQGVVPLMFPGVGPSIIGTNTRIESLDDFQGLSIRAAGYDADVVEAAGGSPVSMGAADLFESMERGVLDGWTSIPLDVLLAVSLEEVTDFYTTAGVGNYTQMMFVMNADVYDGLPDDLRELVDEVSDEANELALSLMQEAEDESCRALHEHGAEIVLLPEDEMAEWRDRVDPEAIREEWLADNRDLDVDVGGFLDEYLSRVAAAEEAAPEPGLRRCAEEGGA